jgi:hypothetical protein
MMLNTKRPGKNERYQQNERVIDVSINPDSKKEDRYDDYQVRPSNKNNHELLSDHGASQYLE